MLHEILLSLSGQPSPLFETHAEEDAVSEDAFPLLSPPEKALLASLARLSRLHAKLRAHTALISSSHHSVICRAVSTAINTQHIGKFQRKILEVEKSILVEDSEYVGGYGIVPLSTMVGEFSPWTRRLEWLWEIAQFILPDHKKTNNQACTGAALIDYLRAESQTGYIDIGEMALHLISAAETAWMRQLSTWLLYGNLPVLGKGDFFIQEGSMAESNHAPAVAHFVLRTNLQPKFVSPDTALSILFIGKTLNLIKAKRNVSTTSPPTGLLTTPVTLHGEHIEHFATLKSPISTAKLSNSINSIRLSLSQSTLSKLLPLPKILEILAVLHDFLLLRRGEFASALVSHADARLLERHRRPGTLASKGKISEGLQGLSIKEGDVANALSQALAELYALQNEEDPVDDELDLARSLLQLSMNDTRKSHSAAATPSAGGSDHVTNISDIPFDDLLFPSPTALSAQVHPPLDLFLSASDVLIYSKIHSYLLGIRRAQLHLGDLWKHTFLRKIHPSPLGPPRSNSKFGQNKLRAGRQRDNTRTRQMRPVWATCSASLFVLSEVGSFFQGEVINGSWQHFREWIGGAPTSSTNSRPGTSSSSKSKLSYNSIASEEMSEASLDRSTQLPRTQHDPETLTVAHRRYLFTMVQALFLTERPFTKALRFLLTSVDHFIALVVRLESIQRNMDLETDEGVVDSLVDYAGEEKEVWQALSAARGEVETGIKVLVARLKDIDDSRSGEGRTMFDMSKIPRENWSMYQQNATGTEANMGHYVPRKAAGVDRLLMKLDFGNANGSIGPAAFVSSG
ncbi:gamma-tubulin complex component GCP4 [Aspergillus bombycis]|uniref:Spindle pole body component n=1 Tax=Aspergillus bombycis TaxID=109264 RepID=A0A1F7ZQ66_9EURO|nr:gamma-tubulin complex component GCP4 [Aspergillus bombycis]OGM41604.1 gamma-tubulin complex component GCP4 [Aspergillus bombycis]